MSQPLKVLIVDDNSLYRRILTKAVAGTPFLSETETAPSGAIALKKIPAFAPELVLLDIEMPDMNGIEVLKAMRAEHPRISVVLVSGVNSRSAEITIEGLTSGASDFIPKPIGSNPEENIAELRTELTRVIEITLKKREARSRRLSGQTAAPRPRPAPGSGAVLLPTRVDVVGIGVSTGGPTALEQLVSGLPESLKSPVVIVQHMPPLFTESLAKALNLKGTLTVRHARDGDALKAGVVYLAPGGMHLQVKREANQEEQKLVIRLDDGPPVNSCKPAVDVLFRSLAEASGMHTLAVVMTGMGQDGREGVADIKRQHGYCLTQSEDTCTVYGMPYAVDEAGLSDESVPLHDLASRIASISAGISQ